MPKLPQISLQEIRSRADNAVFKRGQQYYENGAIRKCVRRGMRLEANCRGSYDQLYQVQAVLNESTIAQSSCTCEYSFGGICKHIIALLLTYHHEPDKFNVQPPVQELLSSRNKEDLIELILQMLAHHPDLLTMVERPTVREVIAGRSYLDEQALREELDEALEFMGEWGDRTAEEKIDEIAQIGQRFAARHEYAQALTIYALILEVCNAHDYLADDEGDYIVAVNEIISHMDDAIDHAHLATNDQLRLRIQNALLGAIFWDVDFGGIGYADGATSILLSIVEPEDIPAIQIQLDAAAADTEDLDYPTWRGEVIVTLKNELDRLAGTDPEVIIERFRDSSHDLLLLQQYLSLQRPEEAIAVVQNSLTSSWQLTRGLALLHEHGLEDAAFDIAESKLNHEVDESLVAWLIAGLREHGDLERLFRWQLWRMQHIPSINTYLDLATTAKKLGNWDVVRPDIHTRLAEQEKFRLLIQAYLHDEDWANAWKILLRIGDSNPNTPGYVDLAFDVARLSRHVYPERALIIYARAARDRINHRTRSSYAEAAKLLVETRKLYQQADDEKGWQQLISGLREEFKTLRAMQDEFNKAGLEQA